MALETSVNEANWKLMSKGSRGETQTSASSYEVITMTWTVATEEYKYFGLTESACTTYMSSNPSLDLQMERQNQFGAGWNLIKRTETRTLTGVSNGPIPS